MLHEKEYWQSVYDVKSWLSIHTTHLSYTRNLILTLAIASLGFTFGQYQNPVFHTMSSGRLGMITASFLFVSAIVIGLIIAINQEKIYRIYSQISRVIEIANEKQIDDKYFSKPSNQIRIMEKRNRNLFNRQVFIFLVGIFVLTISILFPSLFF